MKIYSFLATAILGFGLCACNGGNQTQSSEAQDIEVMEDGDIAIDESQAVTDLSANGNIKVEDGILFSETLPIVVDFYADWCNPCKQYAPTFDEVAAKYAGKAYFVRVNVDNYKEIAERYNINNNIPTTVFIVNGGSELGRKAGILSAQQLEDYINQLLATNAGESDSI